MGTGADKHVRDTVLALLAARAEGATICPSEVARALSRGAGDEQAWREAMPAVHAALDLLVVDKLVQLSWKGEPLATRAGPYRIARKNRD